MATGTLFRIPLSTGNQTLAAKLNGVTFRFNIQYRQTDESGAGGGWFMDVTNVATGQARRGIPLRYNSDLFEQFQYLGWGRFFVLHPAGLQKKEASFEGMADGLVELAWCGDLT